MNFATLPRKNFDSTRDTTSGALQATSSDSFRRYKRQEDVVESIGVPRSFTAFLSFPFLALFSFPLAPRYIRDDDQFDSTAMSPLAANFTLPRYTVPTRRLSLASRTSSSLLNDDKVDEGRKSAGVYADSLSESGYDSVDTVSFSDSFSRFARLNKKRHESDQLWGISETEEVILTLHE